MRVPRILPLLAALTLVPALAACDDADPNGNGNNNANCDSGSLTAQVDGSAFTSECVVIDLSNGLLTISGVKNLSGSSGANQETITLGGVQAQVGTRTPTVATYARASGTSNVTACAASALPGTPAPTITIDAIDGNSASGSFSFTAICPNDGSTVTVANGAFDISG